MAAYQKRPGISTVFVMANSLPDFGKPIYGSEIAESLIDVVGRENVDTVQKINGVWRLSVNNPKARLEILRRGFTVRNHSVSVLNENPYLIGGEETIQIIISNIPSSVADEEIKHSLRMEGLKIGTRFRYEQYRDSNKKMISVKTGRRFINIAPPQKPLPKKITVANIFIGFVTRFEKKEDLVKDQGGVGAHPPSAKVSDPIPSSSGQASSNPDPQASALAEVWTNAKKPHASRNMEGPNPIARTEENMFSSLRHEENDADLQEDEGEKNGDKLYDMPTDVDDDDEDDTAGDKGESVDPAREVSVDITDEGLQAGVQGESLGPANVPPTNDEGLDKASVSESVVSQNDTQTIRSTTSSVQMTLFNEKLIDETFDRLTGRPRTKSTGSGKPRRRKTSKSTTRSATRSTTPKRRGSDGAKASANKKGKIDDNYQEGQSKALVKGNVSDQTEADASQIMTPDWFGPLDT